MKREFNISAFKINEAGYYLDSNSTPMFGDLKSIFNDFSKWITKRPLNETCTFDTLNDEFHPPIYCFEFINNSKNCFLTLWNESHNINNKIFAVNGTKNPGESDITKTIIKKDYIPGFPTYYWINYEHSILFTINFRGVQFKKHQEFNKYFKNFIAKKSPTYVRTEKNDKERIILGYSENDTDEPLDLNPKFNSLKMVDKSKRELTK